MANGKKSFVLYCDLIHTIDKMPNEKAGELFKHILHYVNDLKPVTNDLVIELTFEPIKQQLKRDLERWENQIKPLRQNAGRLGGLAKASKRVANEANEKQKLANLAVNVNVNVNDIKDISKTTLEDCEKIFLEKTAFNWTEHYAKKEAAKFFNFYASKNWMVGKNKMKSLPHAIGGWISRNDKPETIEQKGYDGYRPDQTPKIMF